LDKGEERYVWNAETCRRQNNISDTKDYHHVWEEGLQGLLSKLEGESAEKNAVRILKKRGLLSATKPLKVL